MRTIKQRLTLLMLIATCIIHAQKVEMKWSDKMIYTNKIDGFFDAFVGNNSKNVIAKFSTSNGKRVKLVSFDKATMNKTGEVTVCDQYEPGDKEAYDDLDYYKTIVFEDVIYVFWKKEDREKEEIYVQSFTAKLKTQNKLKKVYEIDQGRKKDKKAELFVVGNRNVGQIIIGGEVSGDKGSKIKLEFKVLKSDFSFANSGQQTLPLEITGRSNGLTSDYEYGDDGNLHLKSYIRMTKEERKNLKKGESSFYSLYTILDPLQNSLKTYTFKFENKNIFNFGTKVESGQIKIFGFFCDLNKDPKGNDTHGIFYAIIDSKSKTLSNVSFNEFTKEQLDNLYAKDKSDRNKAGIFASNKKKQSEDESLSSFYEIEQVSSVGNDLVLFCTIMYNWSSTTCDSKGRCTTRYYCTKNNITAFRLGEEGKIKWASNLDRTITYGGWDIYDVSVINNNNKNFYVTYGSNYDVDSEKKNSKSKKSVKDKRNNFAYSVFDAETGKIKNEEVVVNTAETPKPDRKFVNALSIITLDNRFYIDSHPNRNANGQMGGGCSGGASTSKSKPGYLGAINVLN